jgi:hypothetical protein
MNRRRSHGVPPPARLLSSSHPHLQPPDHPPVASVRGTRHASGDGQAVHLLAVADQQASAVLAQAAVDGKSNEITAFAPLLEPWT